MQVKVPLYVTHVSSAQSVEIMAEKRTDDQPVFGEVLASALGLVGDRHSIAIITSPPLRSNPNTHNHLIELLAS